jgi:hypothetical protein
VNCPDEVGENPSLRPKQISPEASRSGPISTNIDKEKQTLLVGATFNLRSGPSGSSLYPPMQHQSLCAILLPTD